MVKKLHNDKSVRYLSLDWKGKAMHSTHCSIHPVIRIRLAAFDRTLKAKSRSGSLCQRSGTFQNTVQLIVLFMVILFCRKKSLINLLNLPVFPTSWVHVLLWTWLLLHDFGNLLPKHKNYQLKQMQTTSCTDPALGDITLSLSKGNTVKSINVIIYILLRH